MQQKSKRHFACTTSGCLRSSLIRSRGPPTPKDVCTAWRSIQTVGSDRRRKPGSCYPSAFTTPRNGNSSEPDGWLASCRPRGSRRRFETSTPVPAVAFDLQIKSSAEGFCRHPAGHLDRVLHRGGLPAFVLGGQRPCS